MCKMRKTRNMNEALDMASKSLFVLDRKTQAGIFRGLRCGNSSVGRARPCQGRGREFESRFPLQIKEPRSIRGLCTISIATGLVAEW